MFIYSRTVFNVIGPLVGLWIN